EPSVTRERLKRAIYQIICMEEPFVCEAVRPHLPALKKQYLGDASSDPLSLFPLLGDVQAGTG
ncbi:MAG: hypothetical protein ACOY7J_10770, partial [Pseudomonadota bacterium]